MLGLVFAAAMEVTAAAMPAPRVMTARTQTSGYPKLSRCASPVQQPADLPEYSPACRVWRTTELARIAALPVPARIDRVAMLRERMGLSAGQGLSVRRDGAIVPSAAEMAAR